MSPSGLESLLCPIIFHSSLFTVGFVFSTSSVPLTCSLQPIILSVRVYESLKNNTLDSNSMQTPRMFIPVCRCPITLGWKDLTEFLDIVLKLKRGTLSKALWIFVWNIHVVYDCLDLCIQEARRGCQVSSSVTLYLILLRVSY